MTVKMNSVIMNSVIINVTPPVTTAPPSGQGGSILLDGSTYLQAAASSDWDIGTNDFTIEWFLKQTDVNSFPRIFQFGTYPAPLGVSIEGGTFYFWMSGVAASTSVSYNAWHHMAVTRHNGTVMLFVDGVLKTSVHKPNSIVLTGIPMSIGVDPGEIEVTTITGNFTNFNYVVGEAKYTSTFTKPNAPISASTGTKILLLSSDSGHLLTDSSSYNRSISVTAGTPIWASDTPF